MVTSIVLPLLAAATLGSAAVIRRSPLDVQLVHVNDTTITAIVTNTGKKGYNVLHRNSILDAAPSRKLHITSRAAADAPFHGIQKHECAHGGPGAHDFTAIRAGETLYRNIDVAELYGLETESYDIAAAGSLPYADTDSLSLNEHPLSFSSNHLKLPLTATKNRLGVKRTTIESDCSADQQSAIVAANQECTRLANAAAEAATSGDANFFQQYFKDTSEATRSKVASVYRAVAVECEKTPGGTSTTHCTDPQGNCGDNWLLAYTYWQGSGSSQTADTYYCPRYFTDVSAQSNQCHEQSRATNTLHEMTHAVAATNDAAYGMDGISRLSSSQAVNNADTYALFATDLSLGCGGGSSAGTSSTGSTSSQGASTGNSAQGASTGTSDQGTSSGSSDQGGSTGGAINWTEWLRSMGYFSR